VGLLGLKRDRLDLLRRQVRIVGTLEEIRGIPEYVEETKSSASRRMLTIPAFLVEMLAAHLQHGAGGAFVFTGKEGACFGARTSGAGTGSRHWSGPGWILP
jgi:hypothetical protein